MNNVSRINVNKKRYIIVLAVLSLICVGACSDPPDGGSDEATGFPQVSRVAELLSDSGVSGYRMALEPRNFRFPEDHGAHEEFRNEWWYFTGNLMDENGRPFGYQLTLFRFALLPRPEPPLASRWQTRQAYLGHFAVTDIEAEGFHVAERYVRGAVGLAGTRSAPLAIWVDDWRIESSAPDMAWQLRATGDTASIDLELVPEKPVILNGVGGLSQKSAAPGNASYYYSMPRLRTRGRVSIDGESYAVDGLSWLDREWGSSALSRDQQGWDWFALQLSDGSELMLYNLRRTDGSRDSHSAGTVIGNDGAATHLTAADFDIRVDDHWRSPGGVQYPSTWTVVVPGLNLELEVLPAMANQELVTTVRYWEGAVSVSGQSAGSSVTGRGYVELTGYETD